MPSGPKKRRSIRRKMEQIRTGLLSPTSSPRSDGNGGEDEDDGESLDDGRSESGGSELPSPLTRDDADDAIELRKKTNGCAVENIQEAPPTSPTPPKSLVVAINLEEEATSSIIEEPIIEAPRTIELRRRASWMNCCGLFDAFIGRDG
ncbi:suppressor [Wolffia australiana]